MYFDRGAFVELKGFCMILVVNLKVVDLNSVRVDLHFEKGFFKCILNNRIQANPLNLIEPKCIFQIDSLLFSISLTLSNKDANTFEHFKKILSHSIIKVLLI